MDLFTRRPALRWLAPLLAVALLTSAGSVVAALNASARDSLPARSAAQLLVDVQKARLEGLSGTVVQTSELGLPALPGAAGGDSAEFSSLLSGSHTLRVWYDGPDRSRVALLGQYGESDLVRDGQDLWVWSSGTNSARHVSLPAGASDEGDGTAADPALTPQQAADRALAALTPTTEVSTEATAVVAGRPAYQLVLEPKDAGTLVGSVKIAIDGETRIPTRVQVFARGASEPAVEVGFTAFDPSVPDASVFAFNPPPGAEVKEGLEGLDLTALPQVPSGADKPVVVGEGWSRVAVATLPEGVLAAPADSSSEDGPAGGPAGGLAGVLGSLPEASGSWGSGHVLRGTLFSAVLTDDGRVAVGAVAPERLYDALGTPQDTP